MLSPISVYDRIAKLKESMQRRLEFRVTVGPRVHRRIAFAAVIWNNFAATVRSRNYSSQRTAGGWTRYRHHCLQKKKKIKKKRKTGWKCRTRRQNPSSDFTGNYAVAACSLGYSYLTPMCAESTPQRPCTAIPFARNCQW